MPKLSLTQLHSDPRNANRCDAETLEKIKRNIERTGLCPALVVRPHPEQKGQYILLDGHHRKKVLEQLGWEKVDCQVWQVDDTEAQLALATLNRLRGTDDLQLRANLLESLTGLMPLDELCSLIPESAAELDDLLKLASFDFDELEVILEKQIAAEKESLPVAMSFLLLPTDATLVEQTLKRFNAHDRGKALVALCLEVNDHDP